MKKVAKIIMALMALVVIAPQNAFAYEAVMTHWANIRDANGEYLASVWQGETVNVIGFSSENPERTLISYNGISGSVLTEYIEVATTNDDYIYDGDNSTENTSYNNVCYSSIESSKNNNTSAESNNWEYNPSGIYARVTTDLIIRDKVGNQIGAVPSGESVEVIKVSPINSDRMVIYYNGICGSVLTICLEETYADNDTSQYFEDGVNNTSPPENIENYASTGIFSKVTADLVLRDTKYNVIGLVPKGATVEVIQQSSYYSNRIVVQYNGLYGSVLSKYTDSTYADNVDSPYFEDGTKSTNTIEEYSLRGFFSKVTANLVLRDESYNVIGLIPKGSTVEVIQQSSNYPDRMIVRYDEEYGSILSQYIKNMYADNINSMYFEDGTSNMVPVYVK